MYQAYPKAGIMRRFICGLVDLLVFAIPIGVIEDKNTLILAESILCFLYYLLQNTRYGKTWGQSLGKCLVVMRNGASITKSAALKRTFWFCGIIVPPMVVCALLNLSLYAMYTILTIYLFYLLIDLALIVANTNEKRALHDILSDTVVIYDAHA